MSSRRGIPSCDAGTQFFHPLAHFTDTHGALGIRTAFLKTPPRQARLRKKRSGCLAAPSGPGRTASRTQELGNDVERLGSRSSANLGLAGVRNHLA